MCSMGALFARRAHSGKVTWPSTPTDRQRLRSFLGRQSLFNLPDVIHARLGGGRMRSTAFGNEAVVQAQPGQFERQQHTIAIVNLTFELERQRGSDPLTGENDIF